MVQQLARYDESLKGFEDKELASDKNQLVVYRGGRDKISNALRGVSVPTCIAKVMADFFHASVSGDPYKELKDAEKAMGPLIDGSNLDVLVHEPQLFLYGKHLEDNAIAKAAAEHFNEHKALIEKQTASFAMGCIEKPADHSHHFLDTRTVKPFPFTCSSYFKAVDDVQPSLHLARKYCIDQRIFCMHWRGQRCVVQCAVGNMIVCVMPPSLARTVSDFSNCFDKQHYNFLAMCPCYRLGPGDCLYIPFGSAAIPMGVDIEAKSNELKVAKSKRTRVAGDYCSYLIHLPFDVSRDSGHELETKSFSLAQYIAAAAFIADDVRKLDGVKAWASKMSEAPPSAAQAPQAPPPPP